MDETEAKANLPILIGGTSGKLYIEEAGVVSVELRIKDVVVETPDDNTDSDGSTDVDDSIGSDDTDDGFDDEDARCSDCRT